MSNLDCWVELQRRGYFGNHPLYTNRDGSFDDLGKVAEYFTLRPEHDVVIIGCGYGREAARFCPVVRHVWGIDVSDKVLGEAESFLRERGCLNFSPVLAEHYRAVIPKNVDFFYSVSVFQHITRSLAADYLSAIRGCALIQFIEVENGQKDAEIRVYEPSVSWTRAEIQQAAAKAGLHAVIDSHPGPGWVAHWAFMK